MKGIKHNELIMKKQKKCKILNYTEHLFTVASAVTGFASIFAFSLLVGIHMCIASCAVTTKFV